MNKAQKSVVLMLALTVSLTSLAQHMPVDDGFNSNVDTADTLAGVSKKKDKEILKALLKEKLQEISYQKVEVAELKKALNDSQIHHGKVRRIAIPAVLLGTLAMTIGAVSYTSKVRNASEWAPMFPGLREAFLDMGLIAGGGIAAVGGTATFFMSKGQIKKWNEKLESAKKDLDAKEKALSALLNSME